MIPNSNLNVSVIAFGTTDIGSTINQQDSYVLLDKYVSMGGNFIDTANNYANWLPGERSISEKTIGKWMKERGNCNDIILATKGVHPDVKAPENNRVTTDNIIHDIGDSLENLQVDTIDLYYLHRDNTEVPVKELIDTLNDQVRLGNIRYFGCSNWNIDRIEAANEYAVQKGLQGFVANQNRWSLAEYPDSEEKAMRGMSSMEQKDEVYHTRTGLAAVPYNSQAFGFFGIPDPYDRAQLKERLQKLMTDKNVRTLECVQKWSETSTVHKLPWAIYYLNHSLFILLSVRKIQSKLKIAARVRILN